MKRPPEKGSVTWVDLYDGGEQSVMEDPQFEGVKLGIRWVGGKVARRWEMLAARAEIESANSLEKLRKGKSRDVVPELWELNATPASLEAYSKIFTEVFKDGVAGIDGVDGIEKEDSEAACELLAELDWEETSRVFKAVKDLQSLSQAHRFRS